MTKSAPKPIKRRIEITGTPDEVKKMLAVAQKVEPSICKKDRVSPEKVLVWYRSDNPTNETLAAIKTRAKIGYQLPSKRKQKEETDIPAEIKE